MKFTRITDAIHVRDIALALPSESPEGHVVLDIEGYGQQEVHITSKLSNLKQGFIKSCSCPGCGKRVNTLYFSHEHNAFLCRACAGLGYLTQCDRSYRKTPYQRKKQKESIIQQKIRPQEEAMKDVYESMKCVRQRLSIRKLNKRILRLCKAEESRKKKHLSAH